VKKSISRRRCRTISLRIWKISKAFSGRSSGGCRRIISTITSCICCRISTSGTSLRKKESGNGLPIKRKRARSAISVFLSMEIRRHSANCSMPTRGTSASASTITWMNIRRPAEKGCSMLPSSAFPS